MAISRRPSPWWLSPVLTIFIAVIGGIGTWYTVFGDLKTEVHTLRARVDNVERQNSDVKRELQEITKRLDQIWQHLARGQ
jgi:prefoldin subunit 5